MKKIKLIVALIGCTYLIAVTFIVGLGKETTHAIYQLKNFSTNIYAHPFIVSNTALSTKIELNKLREKSHQISNQNVFDTAAFSEIDKIQKNINNNITILYSAYLGNFDQIDDMKEHMNEWSSFIDQAKYQLKSGNPEKAKSIINQASEAYYEHIVFDVLTITNFARNKAQEYMTNLSRSSTIRADEIWRIISLLITVISIITLLILWHIKNGAKMADKFAEEIIANEEKYRAIVETSNDGFWIANTEGNILEVNDAYVQLSGYSKDELLSMKVPELDALEESEDTKNRISKTIKEGHARFESEHRRKDGSTWPVEINVNYWQELGGRFFVFLTDITQKKNSEEIIWRQANFDNLTQLPNRCMMIDHLYREVMNANRLNKSVAVLLIDLDNFKEINDSLGHHMGDALLIDAAKRIQSCVRESDMVCRLGGDEFIVILNNLPPNGRVDRLTTEITRKLGTPFVLDNEQAYVSASIGISMYPNDANNADNLIKNADQAMYEAKKQGRDCFKYFTQELETQSRLRQKIIKDMHIAIKEEQFIAYYQPIIDLSTGYMHKAEALIRWNHPSNGLVSPIEFIPIAEETGLINDIGNWVFLEATRNAKKWNTVTQDDFQISVNLSPIQLRSENDLITNHWQQHLKTLGLKGDSIVLEITEGLLLDQNEIILNKLSSYRKSGMKLAIDDFGTGHSSLSYINKFDVDFLKLDKSFINNIETLPNEKALVEAIISMAHKLGINVIAEGIETIGQYEILCQMGCNYGQGYIFSKPLPTEKFEHLLNKNFKNELSDQDRIAI